MYKLLIVTAAALFSMSSAWACPELPSKLEFDGATFSSGMDLSMGTNCGLSIYLDPRKGLYAPAVMPPSGVPNPVSELNIGLDASGKPCLKGSKGTCSSNKVASLHWGSAVTGVAEISKSGDVFIFSVDRQGKKDLNLPYIKLTGSSSNDVYSGTLEAYDKGSIVGDFHLKNGECTKEDPFEDPSSTKTKLRGNSISLVGSSCGEAKLVTKPYRAAKAQLKIDGHVMPVSGDAAK